MLRILRRFYNEKLPLHLEMQTVPSEHADASIRSHSGGAHAMELTFFLFLFDKKNSIINET